MVPVSREGMCDGCSSLAGSECWVGGTVSRGRPRVWLQALISGDALGSQKPDLKFRFRHGSQHQGQQV